MGHDRRPIVGVVCPAFAGLSAARALAREPVQVTVIDQSNHHLFQPLLYQVATAALTAPDIAAPIRRLLRHQENCTVLMSRVLSIDVAHRKVILESDQLEYDYLLLAVGMTLADFTLAD